MSFGSKEPTTVWFNVKILSSAVKSLAIGFMVTVKFKISSISTVGGANTLNSKSIVLVSNGFRLA